MRSALLAFAGDRRSRVALPPFAALSGRTRSFFLRPAVAAAAGPLPAGRWQFPSLWACRPARGLELVRVGGIGASSGVQRADGIGASAQRPASRRPSVALSDRVVARLAGSCLLLRRGSWRHGMLGLAGMMQAASRRGDRPGAVPDPSVGFRALSCVAGPGHGGPARGRGLCGGLWHPSSSGRDLCCVPGQLLPGGRLALCR